MQAEIEALVQAATRAIGAAASAEQLEQARVRYLGRRGQLRQLMQGLGKLAPAERPLVGKLLNEAQARLEELLTARQAELAAAAASAGLARESLDITLPGRAQRRGKRHPLLATMREMTDIFISLGFAVAEGPEVEDYYHSFVALNYPDDHPAMDEQATFYITPPGDAADHAARAGCTLLRSQTSTVQVRWMETHQPPVRVVVPGRCFRRDTVDATHCHTFHQLEGLCVDEEITFADLKGTLDAFAKAMFGENIRMRFRPDFFPFTEPSAEIALTCIICGGSGNLAGSGEPCRVCKQSGWLEVGGSGMVDPNVLENVGYDAERYTGWAFGFGIDRITMLRHGINDIRHLFENDMRFLRQF